MKFIPILLITLTSCQILQKSQNNKNDPLVNCLLQSDKLINDLVEGYETIVKFLKDNDLNYLLMTALRIVPDAYNEVMKCVKQKVNLQKRFNPIDKLRKELKRLINKIPKEVKNEIKKVLKEKGKEYAKKYCLAKVKIPKVCDHIDKW